MEINKLEGLLAATFSTFDESKELKLNLVPQVVERLIADGVKGIFVGGTNGEGLSLSTEERMATTEAYVRAANKRILIFAHVGLVPSKKPASWQRTRRKPVPMPFLLYQHFISNPSLLKTWPIV
ncbi:dihydrodipicolinate synthase family protein [Niabella sp. W65]|nr:dihydrodipicolinate synthase family protein [Niabella sp. W65]MCH7365408.1 dihydrodipicolinate synthase family protein [Niabella sp. W65]